MTQRTLARASDNFRFSAAVAEFGMLLRDSKFKADASFEQVLNLARKAKGDDENGYRAEFIRLVESAQLLSESITGNIEGIDFKILGQFKELLRRPRSSP